MKAVNVEARVRKWYLGVVAFSLIGLTLQRFLNLDPGPIAPVASLLVLGLGFWGIAALWGSVRAVLPIVGIGAASEVLGLFTGVPFGTYEYSSNWWPTIPLGADHRFPLALPFAWGFIVGACALLTPRGRWWAVGAGLMAAVIDWPMELAMTRVYEYWRWPEGGPLFGVPVTNFTGWWLVAAIALTFTTKPEPRVEAGWYLAGFCLLTAYAGVLQFSSPAWILLAVFALVALLPPFRHRRKVRT